MGRSTGKIELNNIKDTILEIIYDITKRTPSKMSFSMDTLEVDSLDLVEIILRLEDRFNFTFTDDECHELRYWSMNKLAETIYNKNND